MSKGQTRSNQPIPPEAACVRSGPHEGELHRCCLTGTGDHPRYLFLCDKHLKEIVEKSPLTAQSQSAASPSMSELEKRRETRRQKAFNRLGTNNPICAFGHETDWHCMELHHLEGEAFGKTLVIVCRNCHRKLSDAQKDHPAQLGAQPTTIESIGHFLLGLADLLLMLAAKLWEFGEYLIEAGMDMRMRKASEP